MYLNAKEAADQVGMTKQGIIKAIKNGKLSGKKSEGGEWEIDPAELFRVYKPVNQNSQLVDDGSQVGVNQTHEVDFGLQHKISDLQSELEHQRELIRRADQRADEWADRAKELAAQLEKEGADRRQLTALLTYHKESDAQREADAQKALAAEREKATAGFWKKLFG